MSERSAPEVESIITRAHKIAEDRSERTTTAHVLLALLNEGDRSTAGRLLGSLDLRETQVRKAMQTVGDERLGFVDHVAERAGRLAKRALPGGPPGARTGGLHLLLALSREPESAASRCLAQIGHDTSAVGHAALGCLTGGGQKALASAARGGGQLANRPTTRGALHVGRHPSNSTSPRKTRRPKHTTTGGGASVKSEKLTHSGGAMTKRTSALRNKKTTSSKVIPSTLRAAPQKKNHSTAGRQQRQLTLGDDKPWRKPAKERRDDDDLKAGLHVFTKGASSSDPNEPSLLVKLARDLTEAARQGMIDPLVGRERELNRVIDALNRRRGNVPCLVGEPGVGKTVIVEGLALRLASDQLTGLEGRSVLQINVGDVIAGTGVRGALAERLTMLRDEVVAQGGRVVLFLDEVHSLLAATGGAAGEGAQELRSAMASGEFPCILATTSDAYRRYIEQDPGLERRLTRIDVEEPSLEEADQIVEAGITRYADHHDVQFSKVALESSVRLTHRYLTERCLPDKAFAVLDLAGSRAHRRGLSEVDLDVIAEVVSELTGVPADRLAATDAERLLRLEQHLGERIVGHEDNIARIAEALRRNAAGLGGSRPVGSFLMLGPTGVGKTETARALSDTLFPGVGGGMSRFDMSELSEPHSVARLVGAPPGYVGHETGGQLTEAVRTRPYQVVLLDEIEKAHPKVHMLLLQVLEDGRLTDGRGRLVDFSHTIVIMTSNLGVGAESRSSIGFARSDDSDEAGAATCAAARAALPPELWNRFDEVLYFASLTRDQVAEVARLLLRQTAKRLTEERGIELQFDDTMVELLLESGGYDSTLGARPMRRAVQRMVEAPLAEAVLRGFAKPGERLRLWVEEGRVEAELIPRSAKKSRETIAETALNT